MVDRWEGILQAFCSGRSYASKVMVSLVIDPLSRSLRQPSKTAILFMGDSVRGSGNPTIERLSKLETVCKILLSKLEDPLANIWVVEAAKFNGPFACFEGFLSSMSSHGEPLTYDPQNFPASLAITSVLRNCLAQVRHQVALMHSDNGELLQGKQKNMHDKKCRENTGLSTPKTLLFGFSKGGVVLNQILSEMSHLAEHSQDVNGCEAKREYCTGIQEALSETNNSEQPLYPTSPYDLLRSIVELNFLDVGLNCHGAYLTNVHLLENIVKAADMSDSGLRLIFHGTPRQWRDPLRPWIADEKNFCLNYLKSKAKECKCTKLDVSEKIYFEHMKPSLQMHLEILQCFKVGH